MNTCRICWKEIWKTYSDKKLRCSSCRKSVENAIWYNERTVEYVEDELFAWKSEYKKLKKENKKLKEELEKDNREVQVDVDKELLKANDYLIKENKKLKSDLEWYQKHYWPKPLTTIEEVQNYEWNTIWE